MALHFVQSLLTWLRYGPGPDFSSCIKIFVDDGVSPAKTFSVHKDILFARSPYFATACSTRWGHHNDNKPLALMEASPAIFSKYLHILYSNHIVHPHEPLAVSEALYKTHDGHSTRQALEASVQWTCEELVYAYLLSDRLGDLRSCNIIINGLIRRCEEWTEIPALHLVELILSSTTGTSPLRKLITHYYVHEVKPALATTDINALGELGGDLAKDMVAGFHERLSNGLVAMRGRSGEQGAHKAALVAQCTFHMHNEDVPRCLALFRPDTDLVPRASIFRYDDDSD